MASSLVRNRYARCTNYNDTGQVLQKKELWGTFETLFVRAVDAMLLTFVSKNNSKYTIGVHGADIVTVTFPPKLGDGFAASFLGPNPRPMDVLARFSRITGGASLVVPSLLWPERGLLRGDSQGFIVDPTTGLLTRWIDAPHDLIITYRPVMLDPPAPAALGT